MRKLLYAALVVLYFVRLDLWWWHDATLVAGLPVGLLYHLLFCFVVAGLFWWVVRHAWPAELEEWASRDGSRRKDQ